jgi:antitoxin component of MazEF toxin-antitoxin module
VSDPEIRSKIDGEWLPLPAAVIRALNLNEGDTVVIEIVGDTVLFAKENQTDMAKTSTAAKSKPNQTPLQKAKAEAAAKKKAAAAKPPAKATGKPPKPKQQTIQDVIDATRPDPATVTEMFDAKPIEFTEVSLLADDEQFPDLVLEYAELQARLKVDQERADHIKKVFKDLLTEARRSNVHAFGWRIRRQAGKNVQISATKLLENGVDAATIAASKVSTPTVAIYFEPVPEPGESSGEGMGGGADE